MADVAVYLGALLVATLGASRMLLKGRGSIIPAVRHGTVFALAQASSMLASAPESILWADHLLPWTGLLDLCADLLRMEAARALLLLAAHLPWPGSLDRRPSTTGSGAGGRVLRSRFALVVAALLALSARTTWHGDAEVALDLPSRLLLALYDTVIAGYSCGCLLALARTLRRCVRGMAPGHLRQGVVLLWVSAWLGVCWAGWGLDDIASVLSGGVQVTGQDLASGVLGVACLIVAVTGASVRLWGHGLRSAHEWAADYRRYRALTPQWRALHRQLPAIALRAPSAWRSWLPPRNAHFALYRRIIEIHDARLALGHNPQLPPAPETLTQAPLGPPATAIRTEADRLLHQIGPGRGTARG